jgi:hypothetical protein
MMKKTMMKKTMMKTAALLIVLCMAAVFLSGCIGSTDDPTFGTDETLNYAAFLELLEVNGFSFEEAGEYSGFLSVPQRVISIGDELLVIYEFTSHEAMERNASFVGASGFSIDNRDIGQIVEISWVSDPYWFKKDLIIVNYVGENKQIINFLAETLDLFAGHGFVYDGASTGTGQNTEPSVRVTIEEWTGISASALELIYEDASYRYYLSSIRSGMIMLTFENGERISLSDALSQDKISIEDLILNGLDVIIMPQSMNA